MSACPNAGTDCSSPCCGGEPPTVMPDEYAEWYAKTQLPISPTYTPLPDLINQPPHYTAGGIECIDYLAAKLTPEEFRGYLRGNALKYLSRLGRKDEATDDAAKAAWYVDRLERALREAAG